MENKPKYFRLLERDEKVELGDLKADNNHLLDVSPRAVGRTIVNEFQWLRPLTLPQVGWLPIGEKKEFEGGTLFADLWNGSISAVSMTASTYNQGARTSTHYLPPLPVLDGVKEPVLTKAEKRAIFEEEMKSIALDELVTAKAHISELEESLRKAESKIADFSTLLHAQPERPTWQELATFDGVKLPQDCCLVIGSDGISCDAGGDAKSDLIQRGYTHYYIVPEFKPDNSARIAELEKTIWEYRELWRQATHVAGACEMIEGRIKEMQSELAKLKEASK